MSIFSRLFGNKNRDSDRLSDNQSDIDGQLTADAQLMNKLIFTVLLDAPISMEIAGLQQVLHQFDPALAECQVEYDEHAQEGGYPTFIVSWQQHIVRLNYQAEPLSQEVLDVCVGPAAYAYEEKLSAYQHQAIVELSYLGNERDILQCYVALTTVAAALAGVGGRLIIHQQAHTSLPLNSFFDAPYGQRISEIYALPLLSLFCGFVKYQIPQVEGFWLRTYAANQLGLPELAIRVDFQEQIAFCYDTFLELYHYLLASGSQLHAGDQVQLSNNYRICLRAAQSDEYFLDNDGLLLVIEFIATV